MSQFPQDEDLIEIKVAAACSCCSVVCPLSAIFIVEGADKCNDFEWYDRDGATYYDKKTIFKHSHLGCSGETPYSKVLYSLTDGTCGSSPAPVNLGCVATPEGELIGDEWVLLESTGSPDDLAFPGDPPLGTDPLFGGTSASFYKKEQWSSSSLQRSSRFPSSYKATVSVGINIYIHSVAVRFERTITKSCPGTCSEVTTELIQSDWFLVDNSDITIPHDPIIDIELPDLTLDCSAIPPWETLPPDPVDCTDGFEAPTIAEITVVDVFQDVLCVGYQLRPPPSDPDCLFICYDIDYVGVACDDPSRYWCYNDSYGIIDCGNPMC